MVRPGSLSLLLSLLSLPLFAAMADLGVYSPSFIPPFTVDPGEQFHLSFTVFSKGPDLAEHARLTVRLPDGAALVEVNSQFGDCEQQGSDVVCQAPSPFGQYQAAISLSVQAPPDRDGGIEPIVARVWSETPDPNGENDTWSANLVTRRLLLVDSDADEGDGSLRNQIQTMNATCGTDLPCKIVFAREMRIEPSTPLPTITSCNSAIDGGGQSGDRLRVELRGRRADQGNGLEIAAGCGAIYAPGVTIRRLAIGDFPENGISITEHGVDSSSAAVHTIQECAIGTDASGRVAHPNALRGISTAAPDVGVNVLFNTISGNTRSGIAFWAIGYANVSRNRIGIGADGGPLPNRGSGLFAASGAVYATSNEIAWNGEFGISTLGAAVVNSQNAVHDNFGMPIDLGINGPSRAGALRPPVLLDAFYDQAADRTIIRGRLAGNNDQSPMGGTYWITFAAADHRNGSGYVDPARHVPTSAMVYPNQPGDFDRDFETFAPGDLRGQFIVGFTSYARWPDLLWEASSELSDPIIVH